MTGPHKHLVGFAAAGSLLQLSGLGLCFRSGWEDVNLFLGLLLYAFGTPLVVYGCERHVQARGRSGRWALLGLCGPVGALIVTRLRSGVAAAPVARSHERSAVDRWVGWALTAVIGLGWLAGVWWWSKGHRYPPRPTIAEVQDNERLAYQRLELIVAAQAAYRQRDWDGDGKLTYAPFLVHLWQTVDLQGQPVAVDLIPRELGFAMVAPFAIDGYYFKSLYSRTEAVEGQTGLPAKGKRSGFRELDFEREWGVAAIPLVPRETGLRVLVADETGAIWTPAKAGAWVTVQVSEPGKRGWVEVKSLAHLMELQRQTTYPEPASSSRR